MTEAQRNGSYVISCQFSLSATERTPTIHPLLHQIIRCCPVSLAPELKCPAIRSIGSKVVSVSTGILLSPTTNVVSVETIQSVGRIRHCPGTENSPWFLSDQDILHVPDNAFA